MTGADYLAEIYITLDGDGYVIGLTHYTPPKAGWTWGDPENCYPPEAAEYEYDLLNEDGTEYEGEWGADWWRDIEWAIDEEMCARADDEDNH